MPSVVSNALPHDEIVTTAVQFAVHENQTSAVSLVPQSVVRSVPVAPIVVPLVVTPVVSAIGVEQSSLMGCAIDVLPQNAETANNPIATQRTIVCDAFRHGQCPFVSSRPLTMIDSFHEN